VPPGLLRPIFDVPVLSHDGPKDGATAGYHSPTPPSLPDSEHFPGVLSELNQHLGKVTTLLFCSPSKNTVERGALAHELPPLRRNYLQEANEETKLSSTTFFCPHCLCTFNERTGTPFNSLAFPTDIVLLAVLWRLRYKLSLRDVAEIFLELGFTFTYEAIRDS